MANRRTRLIVEAEAKGLDKLQRGLLGTEKAIKGVGKASVHVSALGDNIAQTAKEMDAATKSAERHERATRRLTQETEKANRMKEREDRRERQGPMRGRNGRFIAGSESYTPEERKQVKRQQDIRGFAMGVMQGAGLGEYFPEKGFSANVVGRGLGGGARRVGQGAQSAMFGGVGGMAQALGGVPVVGGMLSGQLSNLMGAAGQGLSAFQQESQLLGNVDLQAFSKAKGKATKLELGQVATEKQSRLNAGLGSQKAYGLAVRDTTPRAAIQALLKSDTEAALSFSTSAAANPFSGIGGGRLIDNKEAVDAGRKLIATEAADKAYKDQIAKGDAARRGARGKASNATRQDFLGLSQFTNQGVGLGMSNSDIRSFVGQMSQAEGGALGNLTNAQGAKGTSLALAMSKLGVDAGTSGAIAKGARLGGLDTEKTLAQVMSQGMRLNLSGSDLLKYVKDSAASLTDIENSGVKFNVKGFGDTAAAFGGAFGMERGVSMAKGLRTSGRRLADSGPATGVDMMALQNIYGYDPSGGDDSFYNAQMAAQEGRPMKGGIKKYMQRLMQGEGLTNKSKARRLTSGLKGQGISIGMREALEIAQSGFDNFETGNGKELDFKALAASIPSGGEKRRATNVNTTERAGKRILNTVQILETAQTKMMEEWSSQSKNLQAMAKSVSTAALDVTKNANGLINQMLNAAKKDDMKRKTESAKGAN